ncbi:unnamed protein product [Durusdinium trenchii]|uniref:UBA domain-containing protein n=1 Tax=Durusdinium trenchii TaxID=1381693 RepID=A0ABP0PSJ9_9DINO
MGFCESKARKALAECVWDVNRAIDLLVSRGAESLAPLPKSVVDSSETARNKSRDDNSTTDGQETSGRFKVIRRVCQDASGQEDTLLAAQDLGWIYAEDPMDASRAGWLPSLALEDEQDGHAWILVQKTMPAVHESQLNVEEGEVLKVNLSSRTPEGWAYAEKVQSCEVLPGCRQTVGTIACTVETPLLPARKRCDRGLATGCVKEILSLVFITPCIWYILTIIGQYDDRLQAKQRAAKVEKENLARSYNDLLSDMDGLLSKSAESSAGLAERTFESKRRDFQRFLERVKERYKVFAGTKDAEQVLRQFKRFCSNWLKVFEECSIDPIHYPKKVINEKEPGSDLSRCQVADLCLDRLKKTEVRFISTQRDQDAQLLRKNKNEFRRMTEKERASRPRQFYVRSSPTKDSYPKEIRCGCGQLVILSMEHARLLIGVFIGAALFACLRGCSALQRRLRRSSTFLILSTTDLLAAEICLIVMLMRFEELDIIQQLEREVKELARQNEQVEKQREKMTEFWSNAQQLTELWLYRTVPRLDLYKEVHNQLEDCSKEDLLTHMAGANQQLEDGDRGKNSAPRGAWPCPRCGPFEQHRSGRRVVSCTLQST